MITTTTTSMPYDYTLTVSESIAVGSMILVCERDFVVQQIQGTGPYIILLNYPVGMSVLAGTEVDVLS